MKEKILQRLLFIDTFSKIISIKSKITTSKVTYINIDEYVLFHSLISSKKIRDCTMSHIYEIITILTLILVFTSSVFSSLIVNTNGGKIRGFESNSILDGKKYYSFLGIPYAKPPLGDLRFQVIFFDLLFRFIFLKIFKPAFLQ